MFPRTQKATLWRRTGSDEYGMGEFAKPVTVKVRWEDRDELSTDQRGNQFTSSARIYVEWNLSVSTGDFIALGVHSDTDPANIAGAFEIRNLRSVPALAASTGEKRLKV